MSTPLETMWFVRVPKHKGPGIVYACPAKNSIDAWTYAAIAMYGESSPEVKASMRREGYRAVCCHITEITK